MVRPKTEKSIKEAASSGDHLALLKAMRDQIAEAIAGGCPPRDLAALTRRLQDIAKDIREIEVAAAQEAAENDSPDETISAETL